MIVETWKLFNLLKALYSLISEIYLWQKHDKVANENNTRGIIVFCIYSTFLIISMVFNLLLMAELIKVTHYLNAYVNATKEYIVYVSTHATIDCKEQVKCKFETKNKKP